MLAVGHKKLKERFFDQRPFTRIVNGWTRAYSAAKDYVVLNQMEAAGIIPHNRNRKRDPKQNPNSKRLSKNIVAGTA